MDKTNVLECTFVTEKLFLTSGTKHLKYWTIQGVNINGKNVSWSAVNNKSEAIVALTKTTERISIGGSASGLLYTISSGSIT